MTNHAAKSFDFGIRIVLLSKWLEDAGKEFPATDRLIESGTGICASLRTAKELNDDTFRVQAFRQAQETQYLLELLVKTDFITEFQSKPLLSECKEIQKEILSLLKHKSDAAVAKGKRPKKPASDAAKD